MCSPKKDTSNSADQQGSNQNPETGNHEAKYPNDSFHYLFEQVTDAIMVIDFNGNFIEVNSALCAMFGYTKKELLQLNVRVLIHDKKLKMQPLPFARIIAGEHIFNEIRMVHKSGSIVYVEANARKFMANFIMVIACDITEGKKAERKLRKSEANLHTIFDTTDTIYVLMDNDLQIIAYNPRAFAFAKNELGHSIRISDYFLDYFPPEKRPVLLSYMEEVLTGKNINYEVSYPRPDGLFTWYHVRIFPITKGDKNVYGLMMAVSDITEKILLLGKLEEQRIKQQQVITDAVITAEENERQQIGLELHDNVNQILASCQLHLNMAERTELKEPHPYIDAANKFITVAINEIRNLSHSLISPFIEEYGLFEALDHLIETISKSSNLTIQKQITGVDENAVSEKLRLTIYRIVQEQFNNILKYAQAGHIHLKLARENEQLLLSIRDNGVGFDPSKKSRGIGLMNIRTRASLFNGKVTIVTSPGNGCELIVSFPETV